MATWGEFVAWVEAQGVRGRDQLAHIRFGPFSDLEDLRAELLRDEALRVWAITDAATDGGRGGDGGRG